MPALDTDVPSRSTGLGGLPAPSYVKFNKINAHQVMGSAELLPHAGMTANLIQGLLARSSGLPIAGAKAHFTQALLMGLHASEPTSKTTALLPCW